jgi:hypothetical protein
LKENPGGATLARMGGETKKCDIGVYGKERRSRKSAPVQTDAVETRDDIYTHGTLWWPKEHNQGMVRAEENENDIGMGRGDSGVLPRANEMSRQPPSLDGSWAERGLEREVGRGAMGADGSGVP